MNMSAQDAVNTLYIGGGTPSVLPLDVLSRIVGAVSQTERLSLVTEPVEVTTPTELFDEFTVEVNPEDIVEKGREYVRGLLALGVNRISMGIQSFNDDILRWMNRRHDAGNAVKAFHILRESGVLNISIDLIFGISQLTDETWKDTIEKALELSPEHISAYQLSIEEGSALAKMVADGRYVEASEEQCRHQYDVLCQTLRQAGYHHYEISNFAKPGFEAVHNSAYWRRAPYIGLGPGAHSLTGNVRSWNSQELPHRQQDETIQTESRPVIRTRLRVKLHPGIQAESWPHIQETSRPFRRRTFVSRGSCSPSAPTKAWKPRNYIHWPTARSLIPF